MKNFGIIGVGGYIAPRHLKAIKDTGNNLIVALDKSDSVGIMDSYFPGCSFYTEYERFDRFVDRIQRTPQKLDFVSVCTPNYLHDAHIRFGLRAGADVICEKPLVLNPWNIDALSLMEKETGHKVYNILQLRLHPAIQTWKKQIEEGPKDKVYDVDLTYITSRGIWYYTSWKGNSNSRVVLLQTSACISTTCSLGYSVPSKKISSIFTSTTAPQVSCASNRPEYAIF